MIGSFLFKEGDNYQRTEKGGFWLRRVGVKCQNEDQRKPKDALVDQKKRLRKKEGRKAFWYHIGIISSSSACLDNWSRWRAPQFTEEVTVKTREEAR